MTYGTDAKRKDDSFERMKAHVATLPSMPRLTPSEAARLLPDGVHEKGKFQMQTETAGPPDFSWEASEIERQFEGLGQRVNAVVRQLKAGKTVGEDDPSLVAVRARSLAEALDRSDRAIGDYIRERREANSRSRA